MALRFPSLPLSSEKKDIDRLLNNLPRSVTRAQKAIIRKAYLLAEDAHKFQKRLSGEPYIIHPLAVAEALAEFTPDHEAISAALLHDVLEDTSISRDTLLREFGETITHLVDGVTKISVLKSQGADNQAINIRKMIVATIKDVRVLLIKLVDKLHNMRTLGFQPNAKQIKISQEVIDIYAPLAGRLGIYRIKAELEDLALYYLQLEEYKSIKEAIAEKKGHREERLKAVISILQSRINEEKIKADVQGRSKHFYSIYKKMLEQKKSVTEIYDLSGLRVLCETIQDCYGVLGIVHTLWNPLPGRFKDYISVPKSNGYQSLHTSVVSTDGKILEIQIRTRSMHFISEFGIAAHWAYKEGQTAQKTIEEQFKLLQNLAQQSEDADTAGDFIEDLKNNLSEDDEVYVFSPKGEIFSMAKGSTVLDFAFRIHTELGLKCAGAKVNDRLISIRTPLKSGDQIHIVTGNHVKPSLNWINILRTSHARAKLRAWFRRNDLLPVEDDSRPREETFDRVRPSNRSSSTGPIPRVRDPQPGDIVWQGESSMETRFANCCSPRFGDRILGFITVGQGISVHKKDCPSILQLKSIPENRNRLVNIRWKGEDSIQCSVFVEGEDRSQLYLDLVTSLATAGADILEAKASTSATGDVLDVFEIEVDSQDLLDNIVKTLRQIPGVKSVGTSIK
ncbi:MAG: bifunctional (p)ppGpp synthetase/guanosine-3',5'-bis(diphosphate) 3'-pyrophosphohydrolase [Leptospiraceae bacterium]|nr:bifunctional (p)ppGpp synthetase/guanosine-3',5'-bis(diphosphate) 3'-pyrophosphohydrolase [Leptospiraceae bacterium]